jgi:hypothetical protein
LSVIVERLRTQHLLGPAFSDPAAEVRWLVAVQAQDFHAAKWSVGQRVKDATDASIELAFNDGRVLRTHVLRPTWHFVVPEDIRWLLQVTGARVQSLNASICRSIGLDAKTLLNGGRSIGRALEGGRALTRQELRAGLARAGIDVRDGRRLAYIVMQAELEGLICSGPRRGRQFTYMLLDERVPRSPAKPLDEAQAELACRYFEGHGPATLRDFAKWSGQTLTAARRAAASAGPSLRGANVDGVEYFGMPSRRRRPLQGARVHLLSIYDEYLIGYADYSLMCERAYGARLVGLGAALTGVVLVNGRLQGTWKPKAARSGVEVQPFRRFNAAERRALTAAAERYVAFEKGVVD